MDEYAAKAEATTFYGEDKTDAELPRALDALERRVIEARERLSLLEDRLVPVLIVSPAEAAVAEATLQALSPPRSPLAERVWQIESQAARLITKLMDITPAVDL